MDGRFKVLHKMKVSTTKTPIPCLNIVKFCNKDMCGVHLIYQKTASYRLDRKSKFRFYLRIFFDLFDVVLVNICIVHQKLGQTDATLLDFKIIFSNLPLGKYVGYQRAFPESCPSKRRSLEEAGPTDSSNDLPEFQLLQK